MALNLWLATCGLSVALFWLVLRRHLNELDERRHWFTCGECGRTWTIQYRIASPFLPPICKECETRLRLGYFRKDQ